MSAKSEENLNFPYLTRREKTNFFLISKRLYYYVILNNFEFIKEMMLAKIIKRKWAILGTCVLYGNMRTATPSDKRIIWLMFLFIGLFLCVCIVVHCSKLSVSKNLLSLNAGALDLLI